MPKIDVHAAPEQSGTRYPPPFDEPCQRRTWKRLGDLAGLTQFGVNLVRLAPGVWSSQRHWHTHEDEFVYLLEGELVLVTDAGEELLRAGDCAGFRAGDRNGHHLQNRSAQDALLLVVGSRNEEDHGEYPDIDMIFTAAREGRAMFRHKDGTPYWEKGTGGIRPARRRQRKKSVRALLAWVRGVYLPQTDPSASSGLSG